MKNIDVMIPGAYVKRWWSWRRDRRGEYRIRARARNGKITYASTEGYKRKAAAIYNAQIHGAPPHLGSLEPRQETLVLHAKPRRRR